MNIRRIVQYTVSLMTLSLLLPIDGLAADTDNEDSIKIGYLPNYAAICNLESINYKGYGYEFFETISKYTGHQYEFVPCTIEEGLEMIQSGELDLLGPLEKTDKRSEILNFPTNNFGIETIILCAPKESDVYYDDFSAFDCKRIGTIDKTYFNYLDNYLQGHPVEYTQVECPSLTLPEHLANGHFNLALVSSMYKLPDTKTVATLDTFPVFYAANKKKTYLIEEIDQALSEIYCKDSMFAFKLYEKYFTGNGYPKPTLSKEQIQLLRQHGTFTVEIHSHMVPLQYKDKGGEPAGICVDIMNQIAEFLDIEVEYVFLEPNTESDNTGVDISLCILEQSIQKEKYDSTEPYFHSAISNIKHNDLPEKSSYVIAIPQYIFLNEQTFVNDPAVSKLLVIDSLPERIKALKTGRIDYLLTDEFVLESAMARLDRKEYNYYPSTLELTFRLMVSKNLPQEYVDIFNTAISTMDTHDRNVAISKNITLMREDQSFEELLYETRYIILFFIIILIAIIFLLFFIFSFTKQKALKKIVEVDKLTGLCTMHKFIEEARKTLATAQPDEYLLMSLDIDKFQYVNEIYGYDKGSQLLKAIAEQLQTCHMTEGGVFARINADYFLIIMKTDSLLNQTCCLRKCSHALPARILGPDFQVDIARGIYVISDPTTSVDIIIDYANTARMKAKSITAQQRPFYVRFTDEMFKIRYTQQTIVKNMNRALVDREFKVVYQPQINLQTNEISGAEALVRWKLADGSIIYPDEFISLFEKNGFIEKLDFYMLESVCRFIRSQDSKRILPKISVNISVITLRCEDFLENIYDILETYDVSSRQIELEITEGIFIHDFETATQKLMHLKEHGFTIAMDDFGSGYSSLDRLTEISFDTLKIDKGIISHFLQNMRDAPIVKGILATGHELGMSIVAEGIETKAQAQWLTQAGCNIGQGYYFSRPISEKEFLNYIDTYQ